ARALGVAVTILVEGETEAQGEENPDAAEGEAG
ncbi:unnamed protein product, partial [marine sediment metagenome]